ncbi:MAG: four helix bundle suffix domain-containing protein [Duncaniella sp.]|nr:four helix bundle suffix domain-containing protein [Duncaniella sp.]
MSDTFLPKGGGYRSLRVYKLAEIIHDLTVTFTEKFIERGSRTKDQMVQAARSGKQNIAEGSTASSTSKETEIKLTNVAKASLEELLLDYEDYLRQHSLKIWGKDHERIFNMKKYLRSEQFLAHPMEFIEKMNEEEYCNLCITLINQSTYMLRRLLEKQQEQFLTEGGIREKMYKARIDYRNKFSNSD